LYRKKNLVYSHRNFLKKFKKQKDGVTWTSKIPLGTSFAIWFQQLFGLGMFFPFLLNILKDTFCHSHQARQSNA
jgi:hypothetical protein